MLSNAEKLKQLINDLHSKQLKLNDFKRSAMLLAVDGTELKVKGSSGSENTLLHCLVLSNTNGINDKEISDLIALSNTIVNARNGYGQSALTALINQLVSEQCSIDDFKRSAMLLARAGADLTARGSTHSENTLLHCLVISNKNGANDKEILELVQFKRDVFNIPDGYGRLALERLLRNQPQIATDEVKKLITLGNALHYRNTRGETLLHTACYLGHLEFASTLVSLGLNTAVKTKHHQTTLHCAASSDNEALWQWLYDNQVAIDAQDYKGQTALHLAAQNNNKVMVNWLIKHKADTDIIDNNGYDALSLLKQNTASNEPVDEEIHDPKSKLFAAINSLKDYGLLLESKGVSKGKIAVELAERLKTKAALFFKNQDLNQTDFKQFQEEFKSELNSKNHAMSEYRVSWSTIIANIIIALTPIGALLLVGHLAYTQSTEGRSLFFFQKKKTTSEEKIEDIKSSLMDLESNAYGSF